MAKRLTGFFVALEGIEGSGKSTVARRLADAFRNQGREVTATREPGGGPLSERIRALVLDNEYGAMAAETEALLFAASRAQLVAEVIRPALARGDVVIVDRFADSSLAYQWGGRGLPLDAIAAVQTLATGGLVPDVKLLLDLPVLLGLQRRFARGNETNRMDRETIAFHERVREAYHSLVAAQPDRWRVIDASRPEPDVWSDVWAAVRQLVSVKTGIAAEAEVSRLGTSS